ncbi:hypothetical protein ACFWF7_32855 [Nocardia sp. NPDC060256]|uniref:hypothetical protein n=1 Tax=unclassified Nocardia TaxID=2637762 RepID=UPI0036575A08
MAPSEPLFIGSDITRPDWVSLTSSGVVLPYIDIGVLIEHLDVRFADGRVRVDLTGSLPVSAAGIWYSPGSLDVLAAHIVEDDTELRFLHRQVETAILFLEFWIGAEYPVIDRPELQRRWSNKAVQLAKLATHLPDHLIETRLVSDPQRLRPGTIIKHASESRAISRQESFFAQLLTEESLGEMRGGERVPMLVQRRIVVEAEHRTFYFSGETCTVELPTAAEAVVVDIQYRPEQIAQAVVVPDRIDHDILRRISTAFGLNFFAVDYMIDRSVPRILEVNPHFSWAWLPQDCVVGIVEAFTRYLHRSAVH